jgi:DNA-binding beta-propeller fold protein YncE
VRTSIRSTDAPGSPKVHAMARSASLVLALVLMGAAGIAPASCSSYPTFAVKDAGPDQASPDADSGTTKDAALGPLETSPPAEIPLAKRLDATSAPLVFDALRGGVWTANGDIGSVSYVDIDTGHQKLVEEIPVGKNITSVAVSPDFAWIAAVDRDAAQVALIDPTHREVRRLIPTSTHPRAAVWDAADPRWLYVVLEDANAVGIIDRTAGVYVSTVPVGRLPSGVAVSRLRRELYVSHRIDGLVTTLAIGGASGPVVTDGGMVETGASSVSGSPPKLTLDVDVALADQPATMPLTVPQGKPFGFEGMAWTSDGNFMWLPHELMAPTHPFQFTETLFPAISVIDFTSGGGLEVQTNPNDPNGVIAGRKLLFGAINLPDAEGNTQIVSQPCAVVAHPNGFVMYALACASEDFLVFDVTAGIAVQIIRNDSGPPYPFGDHPMGLAIDPLGQRAFVLSDQSHTLSTLDLEDGNLTLDVAQIAGPLSVITKDTVDPDTRAGLEAFFNANTYKANQGSGPLFASGDDWISCAGCHLDGFVSTNLRLFEASHVVDPTENAQIGHGSQTPLVDLFSTAPDFASETFNPHDILVAFEDQGGLCQHDPTGQLCLTGTGAIDPSHPTAAATTMAAQVARVIARDLPFGPTWLLSPDGPPVESYDTSWCGKCHETEYAAWQQSAHAHAATDTMVTFCKGVETGAVAPLSGQPAGTTGVSFGRVCAGCHDPVSTRLKDTTFQGGRGVTCLGCHDVARTIRAGGNGDLEADVHRWTESHKASASQGLVTLRTPEFCGGCHQQFVPGTGAPGISTFSIWESGPYAAMNPPVICHDCHMPPKGDARDHSFVGGNVYLATKYGETELVKSETTNLETAFTLEAAKQSDGSVQVTIHNLGAGHEFPTGVTDIREPWVELQAVDSKGNVLSTYGGPDATGLLPPGAARLGIDIAASDGTVLLEHQISLATKIPFDQRVPPKGSLTVSVTPPASLPDGTAELQAVLLYHNVRTTYYRAATGDSTGSATAVEIARVTAH